MKVSREQVATNRRNILDAAVRLFAERGFDDVSVADVMAGAGLTHGGFYGHFRSKSDLVTQSCTWSVSPERLDAGKSLQDYVASYLTDEHRDRIAGGCPFAALAGGVRTQSPDAREAMSAGLRQMIDTLSETATGADLATRRQEAIRSLSTMVGGLILARMTEDADLSDELLSVNRSSLQDVRDEAAS